MYSETLKYTVCTKNYRLATKQYESILESIQVQITQQYKRVLKKCGYIIFVGFQYVKLFSRIYCRIKYLYCYVVFQNANVDITEHGLNRVIGRASRGVTVENTIATYKNGKLYYDPQENTYIRFKDGIAVSYDINSGKIVNVQTQNKPTGRWKAK